MLTAELIKKKALEFGADIVGIGDISLYEGTIPQRDPRKILPAAKCVIGCGFRVPRALYRSEIYRRGIRRDIPAENGRADRRRGI